MTKTPKPRLDIYPDPELVDALDQWRGRQPGVPARADAARKIIADRLEADGFLAPTKEVGKRHGKDA